VIQDNQRCVAGGGFRSAVALTHPTVARIRAQVFALRRGER
jgi:hypothetical protein